MLLNLKIIFTDKKIFNACLKTRCKVKKKKFTTIIFKIELNIIKNQNIILLLLVPYKKKNTNNIKFFIILN